MRKTPDATLRERAAALGLHGLLARWHAIEGEPWLAPLIEFEETERCRRSLERRIAHAALGVFKPVADFDWAHPRKIDRDAVEALFDLDFLCEHINVSTLVEELRANGHRALVFSQFTNHLAGGAWPETMENSIGGRASPFADLEDWPLTAAHFRSAESHDLVILHGRVGCHSWSLNGGRSLRALLLSEQWWDLHQRFHLGYGCSSTMRIAILPDKLLLRRPHAYTNSAGDWQCRGD